MNYSTDILPRCIVGTEIKSRTGASYRIHKVDAKGFELIRDSGKTLRITARKITKTYADLCQRSLRFQASPNNGGISYTVAEEAAIVWALADHITIDITNKLFHLRTN